MTHKLYWETPYAKEFNAKVVSIQDEGIILDQTLFYPYGGNQLSDHGIIRINDIEFEINNVMKEDNEITHSLPSEFHKKIKVGDKVLGKIDWNRRYGLMKSHTSQHIFSAVIKNRYDIDTVRATLNFEEVLISFSKALNYEQIRSALDEINEICSTNNLVINGKIISNVEIEQYKDLIRGNIPFENQIRIIEIKNLDLVCCGGTHVENSTEIGIILIYDIKKGKELKYYIGNRALSMLTTLNIDLIEMGNSLNTTINKIRERNMKSEDLILNIREKNKTLEIKILELTARNSIETINDILIFSIDYNIDYKIISKNLHLFPSNTFVIIRIAPKKYRFISKHHNLNSNNIMQSFLKKYGGKGGGNPNSAQGSFETEPRDLISDLKEFLE